MSFEKTKLAVAVAAGLALSPAAFATNGIIQAGNGMAAHGTGGAGLANANEAMSGFDNPALINQTGDSISMGFSMFMPDRAVTVGGTDYESDAKMFAIPQVAFTSKISNSLSWGIMVNAMGGMNSDYRAGLPDLNGPAPNNGGAQTVDLSGLIVAPTVSFALNNNVSLGGSLIIGYENFRVRNLFDTGLTNEGSTMAYGIKLGVDAKVAEGISVGAVIQPKLAAGEISFFKNFLLANPAWTGGDAALTLPNLAGVGGKFAVGKNIDIVADIMYYQWTSVDVFDFFGWEDQFVYKVGAEWRATDRFALRAGLNYGKSPIKGGNLTGAGNDAAASNYPFPAVSELHLTVGMGYKIDKSMTFNAYYLYSPENEETAVGAPVSIKMSQNAFGLGLNYAAK